ncbi:MAG: sulfatase-like hydrolase/transferase [Deltaproteobacteria bacterium]|nr:sulfatase-like hydrolase/transferase [Deltaproteobacteria bacterium]
MILALIAQVAAATPNLLLISVDGLRADRVGAYGMMPSPTPGIDRLAAEGLVCELGFSQSNESLFSHAVLFTGLYASEIAPPDYRTFVVPDRATLLPEVLRLYGYATGGFAAGGHVKGVYGFAQGFDVYDDQYDFGAFFHTTPTALAWLEAIGDSPFFLFLHGYDTHRPYMHSGLYHHAFDADGARTVDELIDQAETERIFNGVYYPDFPLTYFWHAGASERILDPGGYGRLAEWAASRPGRPITPEEQEHIRGHYDSGALSADLQITRLVEALGKSGAWDHTLVMLVADHGEDLGEHGLYNHRSTLADSATRVPMILAGGALPEALRGQRIPGPCEAIDVVPTLLAAAGAVAPKGLRGRDLLSDQPPQGAVFQEGVLPMMAVRTATHRLTVQGLPLDSPLLELLVRVAPLSAPIFALYDTRTDPGEQRDVLAEQPEVAWALREQLLTWLTERLPWSGVRERPVDDPHLQETLRSRGYW